MLEQLEIAQVSISKKGRGSMRDHNEVKVTVPCIIRFVLALKVARKRRQHHSR